MMERGYRGCFAARIYAIAFAMISLVVLEESWSADLRGSFCHDLVGCFGRNCFFICKGHTLSQCAKKFSKNLQRKSVLAEGHPRHPRSSMVIHKKPNPCKVQPISHKQP